MKIAVLGSGNGAHAVAFECSRAGHDVYMFDFPQFSKSVSAIAAVGGIYSEGKMEGFQKVVYAGTDMSKVIQGAEYIFAVGPAYSTVPFGNACAPYVADGQTYIIMPSSCMGALQFKNALGVPINDNRITVAETHTLPYAVRIIDPARIFVFHRLLAGYKVASIPRAMNDQVFAELFKIFPGIEKAQSVLQTTLQNSNPIIHPTVTTLNAALIERTKGDFYFYRDGVTPAVGNVLKAIDEERIAIGKALGLVIESIPEIGPRQGYAIVADYVENYRTSPGLSGIKAQSDLDHRYYNEDVGYTIMFWLDLAELLEVEVPTMKSMAQLVSVIMRRDYKANAPVTLKSLGLDGYMPDDLRKL